MLVNNNKYLNDISNNILNNTELSNLDYVNEYDDYYIVLSGDYLYLFDHKYNEVFTVDRLLLYDNTEEYDIIYKDDKFMYFNNYVKNNEIVYEYYDIYTYEIIDKVFVGGSHE